MRRIPDPEFLVPSPSATTGPTLKQLIPFPDQNDLDMYGNDVTDLTRVGFCSMHIVASSSFSFTSSIDLRA
jgi:hypothetical protein